MKSHLKIKIKSLAAEAGIIRHEERLVLGHARHVRGRQGDEDRLDGLFTEYQSLREHRIKDVRGEARAACLAYALLREKPYARTEPAGSSPAPVGRVIDLISKYGRLDKAAASTKAKAWLDGAAA